MKLTAFNLHGVYAMSSAFAPVLRALSASSLRKPLINAHAAAFDTEYAEVFGRLSQLSTESMLTSSLPPLARR
jgi:hypothetical protein